MVYFEHLKANWKVSLKCLKIIIHESYDCFAHFIHGLIPIIKIKH